MAKSLIFKGPGVTKQGAAQIPPSLPVAFEDPDAAPFFVKVGWADESTLDPVITYSQEEVSIDPETVYGSGPLKGAVVMAPDSE